MLKSLEDIKNSLYLFECPGIYYLYEINVPKFIRYISDNVFPRKQTSCQYSFVTYIEVENILQKISV